MTLSAFRLALMLAAPLALAACGGGGDQKEKDQRTAVGEVLPGSISDSMLPYDAVRSQPPFAPKETGKTDAKGEDADPDADEPDAVASDDAPAEDAPAAAATTPATSESPAE